MKNIVSAIGAFDLTHQWMTQGDRKGRTPLHLASAYGYLNAVHFIVKEIVESSENMHLRKEYINVKDNKGRTPLFHAVAEGRISIALYLVEREADLESATNENHIEPGSTALMACAEKNTSECFDLLIEKRANVSAVRKDGADAMYIAARFGHLEIIQQIAETSGINLIVNRGTFRGRTALITAALHKHIQVCRVLYAKGANLDHQDDDKFTALTYAANEGHFDVVKWLVANEASIHMKNSYGKTAFMCADANGHQKITRFLQRWIDNEEATKGLNKFSAGPGKKSLRSIIRHTCLPQIVNEKKVEMKRMPQKCARFKYF